MSDSVKQSGNSEQVRKRIPLGIRNVLNAPKKPGFVRRFVNDKDDRIQAFKNAGWNPVTDGSKVGDDKIGKASSIGSSVNPSVGGGQRAVLMELPEELYAQDRAQSQAEITKVENQIRRKKTNPDPAAETFGEVSIS